MNERKLTKSELARREELVQKMKANKRTLVSKYGKDAEKVMYGRATKLAKQTEIMNPQTANKIKETIKLSLMKPVKKSSVKEQDIEVGADRYETEQAISKLPNSVEIVYTDTGRWYGLYTNGKLYQDTREGSQDYLNSFIVPLGGEAITLPSSFDMDELESVENTLKQVGVPKVTSGDYKDVSEGMEEDLDIGHQDDEPHMLRANLYNIGKYAFDLLEMLEKYDNMEGEVDFPHWWQAKIIKALDYMEKTKHYLENEEALNKMDSPPPPTSPELDPMIDTIMENVLKRLKSKSIQKVVASKIKESVVTEDKLSFRLSFSDLKKGQVLLNKFRSGRKYTILNVNPKFAEIKNLKTGNVMRIYSLNNYELKD